MTTLTTELPAGHGLNLRLEEKANEAIIYCTGRITVENSQAFQSQISDLIPTSRGHVAAITCRIVLDLSNVSHVDSRGLGALLGAWKAAQAKGCDLELANPNPRVEKAIEITGLASVFKKFRDFVGVRSTAPVSAGTDRRKANLPRPAGSPVRSAQDRRRAARRRQADRRAGSDA